jgi:hypothetical protein
VGVARARRSESDCAHKVGLALALLGGRGADGGEGMEWRGRTGVIIGLNKCAQRRGLASVHARACGYETNSWPGTDVWWGPSSWRRRMDGDAGLRADTGILVDV